jgi:hypothetical protein
MTDAEMVWSRKGPFRKSTRTLSIHRRSTGVALVNAPGQRPIHVNQRLLSHSGMQFEDFKRVCWEAFGPECLPATANAFYSYARQRPSSRFR